MTKHKYEHHHTRYPQPEVAELRTPYWRRIHHDWRFIAVVLLMLACAAIYVLTGNLAWTNHGHAVPMVAPSGN
jgi:cytochrome c-type biogenesis protein CcmH/NrfG